MKPTEVVQDETYQNLYRLKWPDGVLSEDLYNKPRANDILLNYDVYRADMQKLEETVPSTANRMPQNGPEKPVGALKKKKGTRVAKTTQNAPVTNISEWNYTIDDKYVQKTLPVIINV